VEVVSPWFHFRKGWDRQLGRFEEAAFVDASHNATSIAKFGY
jgi:hypothetical protein